MNKINQIRYQLNRTLRGLMVVQNLCCRDPIAKRRDISFSNFRKEKKLKYTFNSMEIYSDTLVKVWPVYRRVQSSSHPWLFWKGNKASNWNSVIQSREKSMGDNVYAKICKNWSLICVTSFIHSTPYITLRVLVEPDLDRTRNLNLFPRQRTWMHGQLISLNFI